MPQDRVFKTCLIFSLAIHSIFIFANFNMHGIFPKESSAKKIEVVYFKKPASQKLSRMPDNLLIGSKEKIAVSTGKAISLQKSNLKEATTKPANAISKTSSPGHKIIAPKTNKLLAAKPTATPNRNTAMENMLVSYDSKDLSNEPSYLRYHNIVRAKIEKMANENKPYIFKVGKVNLIFTILSSGDLQNVVLAKEGSTADAELCNCAIDSVYAASPFPPFTGDMKEDHLTFQVPISFEK